MILRMRPFLALARMSISEYLRTPEALFWTYGFPIVMAIVLGLAFQPGPLPKVKIVVPDGPGAQTIETALSTPEAAKRITLVRLPLVEAERALHRGNADVLVTGAADTPRLVLDPTRAEVDGARMVVERALQRFAGAQDLVPVELVPITERGSRYIDFLIPGLIGLNLLGAGLFGIGFNLVQMRSQRLLRRLMVAPMGRAEFLLAFGLSRMLLAVPASLVVLVFGMLVFDVPMNGSMVTFLVTIILGSAAFSGLGLLVAARPQTTEAVGGLMNMIMVPMWLLGGSFFSNERFPDWVQPLVQILPLTQVNEVLRTILLSGGSLIDVALPLLYLVAFAIVSVLLAVRWFRWT